VRRVQLDEVMAGHHQTGHDRAVVVPGSLDPDTHRQRRPLLNSRCQLPLERDRPGLRQPKRQGLPNKLPAVISDQAQGLVLTDVDARHQAPGRLQRPRLLHVLLLRCPTDELHDDPLNDTTPTSQTVSPGSVMQRYQLDVGVLISGDRPHGDAGHRRRGRRAVDPRAAAANRWAPEQGGDPCAARQPDFVGRMEP